jgi:ABC-type methionine transport system ATPase subunit
MAMKVRFIYPKQLQYHPLLYRLIRHFDLEANILEAQVTSEGGYVVAVLEGGQPALDEALAWMKNQGVQVEVLDETA